MYDGQLPRTGQKPNTSMVRVSYTIQILVLREKDTSPMLCDTIPPSPVDTLAELDSASPPSILSSAPASGMFTKSVVGASYDPDTFVTSSLSETRPMDLEQSTLATQLIIKGIWQREM